MLPLMVIGICFVYLLCALFFGRKIHNALSRRCWCGRDCAHDLTMFFGYLLWWFVGPATVVYFLAKEGLPERSVSRRVERRRERELAEIRHQKQLAIERAEIRRIQAESLRHNEQTLGLG